MYINQQLLNEYLNDGYKYVPVQVVADTFNVSTRTIHRYTELKILPPPIRFGPRCVRYDLVACQQAAKEYIQNKIAEAVQQNQ